MLLLSINTRILIWFILKPFRCLWGTMDADKVKGLWVSGQKDRPS
jgi:hypothetical protein